MYNDLTRKEKLAKMRQLENKGNLGPKETTELVYLRSVLGQLSPSEMTDAELHEHYEGHFDEPSPKHGMRMHGKGTKRVHNVLSGRAIY